TINQSVTLNGTAAFDLITPASHDVLSINAVNNTGRTLTFGGTLLVEAAPGLVFAAGQTFDLFDWGANTTVTGTFDTIELPALSGGLSWEVFGDQPFDYATGQIRVVPEPMGAGLLGMASLALLARQSR